MDEYAEGGTQVKSILTQYCINVSDIERSIEFWEGTVGIALVEGTQPGVPDPKVVGR